jgi:hypothetical protein
MPSRFFSLDFQPRAERAAMFRDVHRAKARLISPDFRNAEALSGPFLLVTFLWARKEK